MYKPVHVAFSLSALLVLAFVFGCESQPKPGEVPVGFDVDASRERIMAGENVTFTATTTNTYGRDADIRWETTGGEIEDVDGDRVKRVTFDEPGEYKVSADLLLDEKRVATDIVKIWVTAVE